MTTKDGTVVVLFIYGVSCASPLNLLKHPVLPTPLEQTHPNEAVLSLTLYGLALAP